MYQFLLRAKKHDRICVFCQHDINSFIHQFFQYGTECSESMIIYVLLILLSPHESENDCVKTHAMILFYLLIPLYNIE